MRTAGAATTSPVLWGLRRFWLVVVLSVALMTVALPWAMQPAQPVYQASALVVAQTSEMPEEALPRYADAVFASGPVVERVAAVLGVPPNPGELVPDKTSLSTAQNSVVLQVNGFDADPALATRIADEAAAAYLTELNKPGPALGVFTLQSPAAIPLEPVDAGPGRLLTILLGPLAGLALGVGLVLLLLNVRRPLLSGQDHDDVVGAPVIARLRLPARVPTDLEPRSVLGIASLVHSLVRTDHTQLSVIGPERDAEQRAAVASLVRRLRLRRPSGGGRNLRRVVDVTHPVDGVRAGADDPRPALLVLREGTAERVVLRTLGQYPAFDVVGVVVVKVVRGPFLAATKRPLHTGSRDRPEGPSRDGQAGDGTPDDAALVVAQDRGTRRALS